jgi:hypothetical protein
MKRFNRCLEVLVSLAADLAPEPVLARHSTRLLADRCRSLKALHGTSSEASVRCSSISVGFFVEAFESGPSSARFTCLCVGGIYIVSGASGVSPFDSYRKLTFRAWGRHVASVRWDCGPWQRARGHK